MTAVREPLGLLENLLHLKTTVTEIDIGIAINQGIPWVMPHRTFEYRFGPQGQDATSKIYWDTSGPLSYLLDWYGTDTVRDSKGKIRSALYDCGVVRPKISTAEELLQMMIAGDMNLYVFRDDISYGELFDDLMWEVEDEEEVRKMLVQGKTSSGGHCRMFPMNFYSGVCTDHGKLNNIINFGLPPNAFTSGKGRISQVQIDYWPGYEDGEPLSGHVRDPDKSPYCFAIRPPPMSLGDEALLDWGKPRVLPVRGREDAKRLTMTAWHEAHNGVYLVRPIGDHKVSVDLKSPLASLDWLMLDTSSASGNVSLAHLAKYLQKQFPSEAVKIAKDCARVLGDYYSTIEDDLISAIGLPRICVPKNETSSTNGYVKVEECPRILKVLSALPHASGYTGIASYISRVLVRTAIVMHLRGGHIAHLSTRSSMFTPADLIYSMLKASRHSNAEYLRPMILISKLSDTVDTTEPIAEPVPAVTQAEPDILGSIPDDLFQ